VSLSPQEFEEFKTRNTRKCAVFSPGGFRPTGQPLATRFGGIPVGRPGEEWPTFRERIWKKPSIMKKPDMTFSAPRPAGAVCQINLDEAPFVPEALEGFKLITLFCGFNKPDRFGFGGGPMPFADNVTVRTYTSLDELVPLTPPDNADLNWIKEMECRWGVKEDHPDYDDPDLWLPPGRDLADDDDGYLFEIENQRESKLGGYHSSTQHGGDWGDTGKFVLQIASENKVGLNWIDGGVLGLGLEQSEDGVAEWRVDIQFH